MYLNRVENTATPPVAVGDFLEIDLAGAINTNQMRTLVSYTDYPQGNTLEAGASKDGSSVGTTDTVILTCPAENTIREIKEILVYNRDVAAATITIQINNGTVLKTLFRAVTAAGDHIQWNPISGWGVVNSLGQFVLTPHA
jgi:hypothetical protein